MTSIQYADEVAAARVDGTPVVALETTVLSHGMPYPQNLETARAVERAVREAGAIPATIAVLDGSIRVGLSPAQLERVAREPMLKLNGADLGYAVATHTDGATTVAATMLCAALAGIDFFATGGIGGVHRDADRTMDISSDLETLATTPVVVVCSGAKAILDLRKTLEMLETRSVPVIGYGADEFPAFWSRSSGLRLTQRCDTPAEIARIVRVRHALGARAGTVVANPIAAEDEIPREEMERHVEEAMRAASLAGIRGKEVTPWLLDRILSLTAGRSLKANVALIRSNAVLAAQIAVSYFRNNATQ